MGILHLCPPFNPHTGMHRKVVIALTGISVTTISGLHFREYPARDCPQSCISKIPLLYKAEVVHVPSSGGSYLPEDVPLTFIPPGRYVVTSPSFAIHSTVKIWFFPDRGGPWTMSVIVQTDKEEYGREDSSVIFTLQVTDDATEELIQVDTIYGTIVLPDTTQKTVDPEEWTWDDDKKWYTYSWGFINDKDVCADPKEGFYQAEFFVKKKYYADVKAFADFGVCYHIGIDLAFDKDPPEYSLGESVIMTVHVTDENGEPLSTDIKSVLTLFDGSIVTDLVWTQINPGTYSATYLPQQEGEYFITVEAVEDIICYLEEASAIFSVKECEEAFINLEISDAVINEPVTFLLTVTDSDGNRLSGARIESELYYLTDYIGTLSWSDKGDGVYQAEYSPSTFGCYKLHGTVIITGDVNCFKGFFEGNFKAEYKKLPDLLILNDDITIEPEPHIGETVTISARVQNVGLADAENFWVLILINDQPEYSVLIEFLAADQSITIEYEWTVMYSGGFVIQVIVDPPEGLV